MLANWVFFGVARGASAFPDFPDHEEEEEELEVDEAAAFGTGRRALAGRAPVELTRRGGAWRCCFFFCSGLVHPVDRFDQQEHHPGD